MRTVNGGGWDLDDVLVTVDHPFGTIEKPLPEWMSTGPGPRNARPISARSRSTGEALPLTVIPLAYRNDRASRALIESGRIPSPWPGYGGDPPPFDGDVADPDGVDRSVAQVLGAVPARIDDVVATELPVMIRRLAAEGRWAEFDTIVDFAASTGIADAGPVLCEVLGSSAWPPDPGRIVEVLARLRFDDSGDVLERVLRRFVYADDDPENARRCLRAWAAIGGPKSRARLTLISWGDWPEPIPAWAAEELEATGERIPSPSTIPDPTAVASGQGRNGGWMGSRWQQAR